MRAIPSRVSHARQGDGVLIDGTPIIAHTSTPHEHAPYAGDVNHLSKTHGLEKMEDTADQVHVRVADVMVTIPKMLAPDVTIDRARAAFEDPHVHMLLLVDDGQLVGTLLRKDIEGRPQGELARHVARLRGRTVRPDLPVDVLHRYMARTGDRRLAVIDGRRRLLGLVCLKSDRSGFCSDEGVLARVADRNARNTGRSDRAAGA